ncbi:hypothetical protein PENARI_c020G03831 [Penicillium arizonense]|uniref:Uncharacterized protein n=1 Tax=Penicillium arizonense TaxID=1835702 RepID=A0A1F5L958_PENAI|nr:hypothetical protein PENARI_c020G03831 [Penicillium arizonense]OGE49754.1 hypothetical protein PENARI_c020G03831 [Penicillium arizonense]
MVPFNTNSVKPQGPDTLSTRLIVLATVEEPSEETTRDQKLQLVLDISIAALVIGMHIHVSMHGLDLIFRTRAKTKAMTPTHPKQESTINVPFIPPR